MQRFFRHDGFFILTLIGVLAFLLWARAVPMAIGQGIMQEAAGVILGLLVGGPLLLWSMAAPLRTWPRWTKQLLLSVVGWAMMCGAVIITEVQLSTDGVGVGIMAVIFAIAVPWLVIGQTT
jgi:hypothetical protein